MTHQYMELKIKELEKRIEVLEGEPSIRDELPSVTPKQSGWIPVGERLPKEGKTVIASVKDGVYPEAKYTKEYGWLWAYEAGADYWVELEDVTAWMPLPKSYVPDTNVGKMSEIPTGSNGVEPQESEEQA